MIKKWPALSDEIKAAILKMILCLILIISCGCQSLIPHPRAWTKQEKQAAMIFLAAHTANYYTTEKHQDRPNLYYEVNPIMGRHPSDREIGTYFSITGIGTLVISHFYPELRQRLLLDYAKINTIAALHDYNLTRR